MALTKTENTQALEWTNIAGDAVQETSTIDVSGSFSSTLHIDVCLAETGAHLGTEIIIQVASEAAVDDAWSDLARFIGPVGTAVSLALAATEPAAETTLAVTNPATAGIDNDGKFKYIENTVIADSEIVYQISNTGDGGDTITILDGLGQEQDITTSVVFDIDDTVASAVGTYAVAVPTSASQARVVFNNTFDKTAAKDVHVRVRLTKVTALA